VTAETGYAQSDGGYIAYSVVGEGDLDLLYLSGFLLSIDSSDDEPHSARYFRRLAGLGRLIRYDRRGMGLSDPMARTEDITIASMTSDAVAVLDAVGVGRVAIVADPAAEAIAIELAASYPARVAALVLICPTARFTVDEDYPVGYPVALVESFLATNTDPEVEWARGDSDDVAFIAPSLRDDLQFRRWWTRESRRAAGPATAARFISVVALADVRDRLTAISVPTLVLHRSEDLFVPIAQGRYVAEHIAGARFVELGGADHMPISGDVDGLVDEIEDFLTGHRSGHLERVLTTVLFTDIVESTVRAASIGDQTWGALLDSHDAAIRAEVARYGGTEVNTTGDGFVVVFDSPTQAVTCALAIVAAADRIGVAVRAGIHVGECERRGTDIAGIAVHIAARIMSIAEPGQVWVSRTVCDTVVGSGLTFEPRGPHTLRGLSTPWELFTLTDTATDHTSVRDERARE
jgi:class 3 adenylate cyclase/pimeloyl-ACP methyl ester carboxylesterase